MVKRRVGRTSRRARASASTGAAEDVLEQLMAGNARFASGRALAPRRRPEDYRAVAERQYPIAAIVSCADSRVPPELVFDMGVGDLFVVRIAGNVVSNAGAAVKGSIEYAVAELKVPVVFVLGHSGCGAVKSAVQHIARKDSLPGAIDDLVELVKPAVARVEHTPGDKLRNAIRANVQIGVERLVNLEPILAPLVRAGRVNVSGGVYDLRTGRVALIERAEASTSSHLTSAEAATALITKGTKTAKITKNNS